MCNKMSDVRLSNASPTLERVDPARIIGLALQDGASRPPVCRNLFGSPPMNLEDFQRDFQAQMAEEQRKFAERWSYDVVADRPLEVPAGETGCEWEEVSDAPDFYCRAPHEKRRPRTADRNGNRNNRGGGADDGRSSGDRSPCRGDSSPDGSPRRRRQRAPGPCSDDSPRKRLRYDDDDEGDEDDQSNCTRGQTLTSVEETPSKADSREQLG